MGSNAIIAGLGSVGLAYFEQLIDKSFAKSQHAFEELHKSVDYRLQSLEEALDERSKIQKVLSGKTKKLCKFANLFNNPTYDICDQGYNANQVVGPDQGQPDNNGLVDSPDYSPLQALHEVDEKGPCSINGKY